MHSQSANPCQTIGDASLAFHNPPPSLPPTDVPFLTRYSARSVASMSAESPASILSGLMVSVERTPVAMRTQSYTVSTVSNMSSQDSWKSCTRKRDGDASVRKVERTG
jgi:hypothetical protein